VITRYGRKLPAQMRICKGGCEGMGFYPSKDQAEWPKDVRPLGTPEADGSPDDGCRFVKCPDCRGTGQRSLWESLRATPKWLVNATKFFLEHRSYSWEGHPFPKWKRYWITFRVAYLIPWGAEDYDLPAPKPEKFDLKRIK